MDPQHAAIRNVRAPPGRCTRASVQAQHVRRVLICASTCTAGPAYQLDRGPGPQAPRDARSHLRRQEVPWAAEQGARQPQAAPVAPCVLEEAEHQGVPPLPLEGGFAMPQQQPAGGAAGLCARHPVRCFATCAKRQPCARVRLLAQKLPGVSLPVRRAARAGDDECSSSARRSSAAL